MPVVTRSQKKANKLFIQSLVKKPVVTANTNVKSEFPIYISHEENKMRDPLIMSTEFKRTMEVILLKFNNCNTRLERIENAYKLYKEFNDKFDKMFNKLSFTTKKSWFKFTAVALTKVLEFYREYNNGDYDDLDSKKVNDWIQECDKAKNYIVDLLLRYKEDITDLDNRYFVEAYAEIEKTANCRPRRNIPRVNYTGMDAFEPDDKMNEETDIWADKSIKNDPDYVFEEDKDDDEEPSVSHPIKLTQNEKNNLKKHIIKLVESHRVLRNKPCVDYSGMELSDDEVGQIIVRKRKIVANKVKYIYTKYSLSKLNEIEDEDYQG